VLNSYEWVTLEDLRGKGVVAASKCFGIKSCDVPVKQLLDDIEDCRLTYNDILAISNPCIAELVYAVTNEKGRTRGERANSKYYEGIIDVPYATFVKLCDRLANIKYSDDVNSTMFHKYGKEHDHFLNELFPSGDYGIYEPMVIESKKLLRYNSLN